MSVEAHVTLGGENLPPVGRERIRLLEEVGRAGSISGAARAVGITYKAAWDGIAALNNLFGRPVVAGQAGGKRGGGTALTPEGLRVIETFHRLEAELARTFKALEPELAGSGLSPNALLWSFLMRTSARNALRCTVAAVTEGAVNSEVTLDLGGGTALTAIITCESVRELGLCAGREAVALIKSSFVMLAPAGEVGRISVRNRTISEAMSSRRASRWHTARRNSPLPWRISASVSSSSWAPGWRARAAATPWLCAHILPVQPGGRSGA